MTTIPDLIAVIDNDPYVLKALARLLAVHDFKTRTFASAREFLASLGEGHPACLVADLQMPGMTGLELQQELRREGIRIPTVIITAHYEAGIKSRCEAAGAIAFLSKPLQDTTLLAAIERARRLSGAAGAHDPGDPGANVGPRSNSAAAFRKVTT